MVFLSHPHHRYTQTFDWLLEALGEPCKRIHGDRATLAEFLPSLVHSPPRLLLIFQLEHLAPWCSLFCPVILFPMFDCTRGTPDTFLQALTQVEWVSFSRTLHQRLSAMGLSSRYLRYAPNPDDYPEVSWDQGVKGYFWERTPEHLDRTAAAEIFRSLGVGDFELRSLHDQEFAESCPASRRKSAESAWHHPAAYLAHLQRHQVYLAPRRFEGLGLTFLEAMAMGMCVVAEDQPTAGEYITSGTHGILYRGDDYGLKLPRRFGGAEFAQMGRQARQHLGQLHAAWRETRMGLAHLVKQMASQPHPQQSSPQRGLLEATLEFATEPARLWALVHAPPRFIYRSARQKMDWGSRLGRLRTFLRRPRQYLLRALARRSG